MRGLMMAFLAALSAACLDFEGFETGSTGAGGSSSQGGGGSGPVTTGGGTTNTGGSAGSGGAGGSGTGGGSIAPCVTDDFNSTTTTGNLFDSVIESGPATPPMISFGGGRVTIDVLQGQAGGYKSKVASDLGGCFVSLEASTLAKDALTYVAIRDFAAASSRVRAYLEPLTGNNVQVCADVDGISLGCSAVPDTTKVLRIAPGTTDLLIEAIDAGASVASFTTPRPNWLATGSIAFGVDATTKTGPDQESKIESLGLTPP